MSNLHNDQLQLAKWVGRVISESPYVKLLSEPRLNVYELYPGMEHSRWEAVAQVNGTLCVVELKVTGVGKT